MIIHEQQPAHFRPTQENQQYSASGLLAPFYDFLSYAGDSMDNRTNVLRSDIARETADKNVKETGNNLIEATKKYYYNGCGN